MIESPLYKTSDTPYVNNENTLKLKINIGTKTRFFSHVLSTPTADFEILSDDSA